MMVVLRDSEEELRDKVADFKEVLQPIKLKEKLSDTEFIVFNEESKREHKVTLSRLDIDELVAFDAECDCEDFRFRGASKGKPCKHILAVFRDVFVEPVQELKPEPKVEVKKPVSEVQKVEKPVETPVEKPVEFKPTQATSQPISTKVSTKFIPSAEVKGQISALVPPELQKPKEETEEEKLVKMVDELDEKIIMKEFFVGQTPLVYRIPSRREKEPPRLILSIRGWIEAALLHKNIIIEDIQFLKVEDKLIAIAWVRDTARNVRTFGVAERATGEEFRLTMLASKAMRNALKAIVAPEYEKQVLEMASKVNAIMDLKLLLGSQW